eukprot:364303-Chlamydomonas_euryale.AAC.6
MHVCARCVHESPQCMQTRCSCLAAPCMQQRRGRFLSAASCWHAPMQCAVHMAPLRLDTCAAGERLSPWVGVACVMMGLTVLFT